MGRPVALTNRTRLCLERINNDWRKQKECWLWERHLAALQANANSTFLGLRVANLYASEPYTYTLFLVSRTLGTRDCCHFSELPPWHSHIRCIHGNVGLGWVWGGDNVPLLKRRGDL